MRTECNMQREPLVKYCEDKTRRSRMDSYPRGNKLQNAEQSHFLAASSRKELEVTILLFCTIVPAVTK